MEIYDAVSDWRRICTTLKALQATLKNSQSRDIRIPEPAAVRLTLFQQKTLHRSLTYGQMPIPALCAAVAHSFAARLMMSNSEHSLWKVYERGKLRLRIECIWCNLQRVTHPCLQAWEVYLTPFPQDLPSCSPYYSFYLYQPSSPRPSSPRPLSPIFLSNSGSA